MGQLLLTKTRIQSGVYEGVLKTTVAGAAAPQLELRHLGVAVGKITLLPQKDQANSWSVLATIPANSLTDGVQGFLIVETKTEETLDQFTIITGQPLEDDIYSEITLLRAELDMLKMAFRRHCVETGL